MRISKFVHQLLWLAFLMNGVIYAQDTIKTIYREETYTEDGKTKKRKIITTERTHSKIKLYELILDALEGNKATNAIKWLPGFQGRYFVLNGKKFLEYYQAKADSSAKWISLKNRLALSKTGFYSIDQKIPPDGYTNIYTHWSWVQDPDYAKPVLSPEQLAALAKERGVPRAPQSTDTLLKGDKVLPTPIMSDPMIPSFLNVPKALVFPNPSWLEEGDLPWLKSLYEAIKRKDYNKIQEFIPIDNKFLYQLEGIPAEILARTQPASWKDYTYNVLEFFNELFRCYKEHCPGIADENDKTNCLILVDELGKKPTDNLVTFQNRFVSSWECRPLVKNIRRFIADGACDWYMGQIDLKEAKNYLLGQKPGSFFIHALPCNSREYEGYTPVFSLTYRKDEGEVAQVVIYRDSVSNLCIIDVDSNVKLYENIKEIIDDFITSDMNPISQDRFKNLIKIPPKLARLKAAPQQVANIQ